ncbi:MAG: transcription antitermination factor NusB [Candidatus Woesearchaeota archaeon]
MSRKFSRDLVFQLIFQYTFDKKSYNFEEDIMNLNEYDKSDMDFIRKTYTGVVENYDAIIKIIETNLNKYRLERIYKLDLSIIILAVYELMYSKETSESVIINEAVELAKRYSTEKSFKFINGVLGSIVKKEKSNEA